MKKVDIIFGLFVVGVLVIAFKDKIFKKKESTPTSSSGGMSVIPSSKPINTPNLGLNTPTKPNIGILTPKYDNPQDALDKVIGTDSAGNVIIQKPDGKTQTLYQGALQNPNRTYKDKFGNHKIGI
jgi:hypothetical protein